MRVGLLIPFTALTSYTTPNYAVHYLQKNEILHTMQKVAEWHELKSINYQCNY